ncbi:aminopeptidase N [Gallaecimonas xiamenensis]|uniref:Aminopeptidase N n=1 Tax=Gallaecimonas xiamenensis 3-C-1 TaxID=745411 RepID=K2IPZ9_9GAMM|nr:aminopeptidase N [Gallaecimonas xiamenensis]EKE72186.1 aminopeptidase N [Gallaecimonas xiamenensis 3-C-1]
MAKKPVKRLSDYRAPAFTVETLDLCFELHDTQTKVTATSTLKRAGQDTLLRLDGEHLELVSLTLDGKAVDPRFEDGQLLVDISADSAVLEVVTLINPEANTALEGLYKSGGAFCTQCEAEGFRRITYFQDRPDVLAVYTTKVIAEQAAFPQLLSNGNLVESGALADGRHFATWHDPHPKPCYLFALVAGDFDLLEDSFTTQSGREVLLQIFVDKGRRLQARHAMDALKGAMTWDEQNYGLEYDLDRYMIVAVDFFNMGAMENKGLNLFNAKYVLADDDTATDQDYDNIAAIIAHEYFHNWTGNRVTCRDWFQLSLKEGLTVFRDQQFSSDWAGSSATRIKEAQVIRSIQFAEDAGPMSHPIRPQAVAEMNNFYTVTVYNKGAEVIRMLHGLLGKAGFRAGMDLYFKRHDGQAVTCDDFVDAMADANQVDLSAFKGWYSQSGTPVVAVKEVWEQGHYGLKLSQHTPATADQKAKGPLPLPFAIELIGHGRQVLQLDGAEQIFALGQFDEKPVLAPLCGFSAPVKLVFEQSDEELAALMTSASDGFVRVDAAERLLQRLVEAWLKGEEHQALYLWLEALHNIASQPLTDAFLESELFKVPGLSAMQGWFDTIDLDGLVAARQRLRSRVQDQLFAVVHGRYQMVKDVREKGARALANSLLSLLAEPLAKAVEDRYHSARNMTERQGALTAAVAGELKEAEGLLKDFAERFEDNPQVLDKWLMLQGQRDGALKRMPALTEQGAFNWANPNRTRALFGTFIAHNPECHSPAGYRWLEAVLPKLDAINPQATARMVGPLLQWRRFDAKRQAALGKLFEGLKANPALSADLGELLDKALAG